ncbi:MAG: peptidyl-prolyl cis-trans isomerase [Candidatus Cyclobacteriaceae bacterium M3_2C_046]
MKNEVLETSDQKPIARVDDKYLYTNDISGIVPVGINPSDSANTVQRYINNWIKKQLMITEASNQIEFDQAELQRKMLDYRYALMIYEFEKIYINSNLETDVNDEEVSQYYNAHADNFQLRQNILRGIFVQMPKQSPRIGELKRSLRSKTEKAKTQLKSYCLRYATKSHLEDSVWLKFDDVFSLTPINVPNQVQYLRDNSNQIIETSDENYLYYIRIDDFKVKDEISPLEFVRDDIKTIILNRRKTELAKQLEEEIYNKAVENNDFEIYVED